MVYQEGHQDDQGTAAPLLRGYDDEGSGTIQHGEGSGAISQKL